MDQNELKRLVGKAALNYVKDGDVLGVGTGSTVDCFIDALAQSGIRPSACVSSSERSTKKLLELGFKVIDLSEVEEIGVYVDGADEINDDFEMIKGGGGALTREKIVASVAKMFVCIADESKLVKTLGKFPLPVEVIPMAVSSVARSLRKLGADPVERDFTTDADSIPIACVHLSVRPGAPVAAPFVFCRRDEQQKLCAIWDIEFIEMEYDPENWLKATLPYKDEPERGARCSLCFELRLQKVMTYAKAHGFACVASVLGVSRWKNLSQVNAAAAAASAKTGVPYLEIEGRKHGMQEARLALIKELMLYNQDYCGCVYSRHNGKSSAA